MKESAKSLADLRKEYSLRELSEDTIESDPFKQFQLWFNEALEADVTEPNAMVVSTVSAKGRPSSRILLLKGFSEKGFVFFTNYNSKKGQELTATPFASINFFWPDLERQVRIEGMVQKVSREESVKYFKSRPRGSQIGAWVSAQSTFVDKEELLQKLEQESKRWENKEVECPEYWGGFILVPDFIEFWQGRPNRLHDRLAFCKVTSGWEIKRLSP